MLKFWQDFALRIEFQTFPQFRSELNPWTAIW